MSKPEYTIGQSLFYRKGRGQGRYIVWQCFGNHVAAFATELEIRMTNRLNTLHSKLNSAPIGASAFMAQPAQPMKLGNMRKLGVRRLIA